MTEQSRAKTRTRRRTRSWALFVLVASLLGLFVYALAETVNRGLLVPAVAATAPPLVPAMAVADRHDWLANGMLATDAGTDSVPREWQRVDVTEHAATLSRPDSYLVFACTQGPCISGLLQQRQELPAGHYTLEADVYLGGPYTGLAARLGFDPRGEQDARSPSLCWSAPGNTYGWQRLALEVDHEGGTATVFVVFDVLVPEGEGRVAGLRLLGPPEPVATEPAVVAANSPAPSPSPMAEERVLLVGADELKWGSAAELRTMVERAKDGGFTTIYLQVRRLGFAYYDSAVEPAAPQIAERARARWDPLAEAVALAHDTGLLLYAWVDVLPVWQGAEPPPASTPEHVYNLFSGRFGSEWLQAGGATDAATVVYASPAQPQVRTYLASVCRDLASRYQVDGVFLTGVRYAAEPASDSTAATAEATLATAEVTPAGADEGESGDSEWRRSQLTALLQAIVAGVHEGRPAAAISVAVSAEREAAGDCDRCEDGVGWAGAGLADLLVLWPEEDAIYARPETLQDLAAVWTVDSGGAVVVPVVSAEVRSFVSVSRAIAAVRQAGAGGVAVSSYGSLDERGYWDDLARDPFAIPAAPVLPGGEAGRGVGAPYASS